MYLQTIVAQHELIYATDVKGDKPNQILKIPKVASNTQSA